MSALDAILPKIGKFIRLLATDNDHEALSAARALGRTLESGGLSFNDLGNAVERSISLSAVSATPESDEPETWHEVAVWCQRNGTATLSTKECQFLADMGTRLILGGKPSEKQELWLRSIYSRLRREQDAGDSPSSGGTA